MTDVGFWRNHRNDIRERNRQLFGATSFGEPGRIFYLFPQGGGPRASFTTFGDIKSHLRSRDIIVLGGVLREQVVAPEFVHDVAIIGAVNRAYQATDSGDPIESKPTGAGATWLAPTSAAATTPLIEIPANTAGWMFENIMFSGPTDDAAIKITNAASSIGSSHHVIRDCYFSAGLIGIEDNGGFGFTLIERCRFRGQTGANGGGIVCTSTANAVPLMNHIRQCVFRDNQGNFLASQQNSIIEECSFDVASAENINTAFNTAQGGGNHVVKNSFNIAAADFDPAGGVTGHADDVWYNYLIDAVESGQPAN